MTKQPKTETVREPLGKVFEALACALGFDAVVLVSRLPDGAIAIKAAPETKLLKAAPARKAYPFTLRDKHYLKKMGVRL